MNADSINYLFRRLAELEQRVAELEAQALPKQKPNATAVVVYLLIWLQAPRGRTCAWRRVSSVQPHRSFTDNNLDCILFQLSHYVDAKLGPDAALPPVGVPRRARV